MDNLYISRVSGEDIEQVVDKIEKLTKKDDPQAVFMACLAMAIFMQCPHVNNQELRDGIKGASEWIALYVNGMGAEADVPKNKVN